jgi:endonuclease I
MQINKKILSIAITLIFTVLLIACDTTNSTTTTNTTTTTTTNETTTNTTTSISSSMQTTESTTEISSTETVVGYTSIEITDFTKRFYQLNEEFDFSSIELTAHLSDDSTEIINAEDINIRGFNSSTTGEKNIFIIFDKFLVELKVIILADYAFEIDMEYYQSAINLKGQTLKVTLNNILHDGFNNLLYGDARDILQESDEDPNNPDNIILVYLGASVPSRWDGGTTWNREHVWPQSRLGIYVSYGDKDFPSRATDVHNLKPANPSENGARSNDYFDYFKTFDTYEPRDEVKGDIARIIFYMATMYSLLSLNDNVLATNEDLSMGILSVLLEWNELDPVDDFERNRNNVIYTYQNNRNPFIDYPGFADLIWGDLATS